MFAFERRLTAPLGERRRAYREPELLDDAAHEPAPTPAVRQHRERELLLRHEQEQRLVARDRAFVVERDPAARVAHPPAEAVAAAEGLRLRLAHCGACFLDEWSRPAELVRREREQVADRRPEPARRTPRDRIRVDRNGSVPGLSLL